jgi:hypothetical protein
MPEVLNIIGLTVKSTPLKERLAEGQQYEAGIVPPVNSLAFGSSLQLKVCYVL